MCQKNASNLDLAELERSFADASNIQEKKLRDSWDNRADEWDRKYRREEEKEDHQARILDVSTWLRQRGLLGPEQDVADIGCGPGRFVAEFAKTARSVTGVDVSPKMIQYPVF